MREGGFFEQKRASPTSLAVVILLHATALAAVMLIKGPAFTAPPEPLDTYNVPIEPEPEPNPEPPPQRQDPRPNRHESVIDRVPPVIDRQTPGPIVDNRPIPPIPPTRTPPGDETVQRIEPAPPPVRREAVMQSSDLQPPYPASEERAEREGSVRIRVTIGTNGRVVAAEKVSATSDAFWQATERHARSRWRFRPATVDGRPVESSKVLTVTFRLQET